jgi:hypothetical protein
MDTDTFKRFHRTHISKDDFDDALRFIRAARKHSAQSEEFEALLISAIISYSRPFSSNEQGKYPPVDARLHPELVQFQGTQLELHKSIINARNKAVAHAEATNYPVEQVAPSVPDGISGLTYLTTSARRWHVVRDLNPDLDRFEAIADAMRARCSVHMFDMAESSYKSASAGRAE